LPIHFFMCFNVDQQYVEMLLLQYVEICGNVTLSFTHPITLAPLSPLG